MGYLSCSCSFAGSVTKFYVSSLCFAKSRSFVFVSQVFGCKNKCFAPGDDQNNHAPGMQIGLIIDCRRTNRWILFNLLLVVVPNGKIVSNVPNFTS